MVRERMVPYEGTEPYIFLSYSSKDRDRVFPLMKALQGAGYRIWWDDAIQEGNHITYAITEHIKNCSVFLLMLSQSSDKSPWCQKEFHYSQTKGKPLDAVRLEAGEFDYFDFHLGNIHTGRLLPGDSIDDFVENFGRNKAVAPCRECLEPEPLAETVPDPAPVADPASEPVPEPVPSPEPVPPAPPRPRSWIMGLVILVILLFLALCLPVSRLALWETALKIASLFVLLSIFVIIVLRILF